MKVSSAIAILACAFSATASPLEAEDSLEARGYTRCVPQKDLEAIVPKYVATFSGITDGGKVAREIFAANYKLYSQSVWWVSGVPDLVAQHAQADDFPPVFNDRADLIKAQTAPTNNPNAFIVGPVAYGCNTFSFYWKGDFSVSGGKPEGRANGIDMVFLDGETGKVTKTYSEYNTLNQAYGWGAHLTWSSNPVCCDCPVVFDPSCKCPTH